MTRRSYTRWTLTIGEVPSSDQRVGPDDGAGEQLGGSIVGHGDDDRVGGRCARSPCVTAMPPPVASSRSTGALVRTSAPTRSSAAVAWSACSSASGTRDQPMSQRRRR